MSDIKDWDPESGSAFNADAPPDGAPEGMPPSAVNDVMREIMAAVRRQWEQAEWFEYGHDITRTSGTTFNVDGDDKTNIYTVGRRVRIRGVATGTLLGTITESAFSVVTSVTIEPDAGTIVNESISVALGIADPAKPSIPSASINGLNDELSTLEESLTDLISESISDAVEEITPNLRLVGERFAVWDHISGVSAPDNSGSAKYIRLTAGQSGPGQYNEGLITGESVSGSAPYINATAQISVGPMAGQTVRLVNTERRFFRAGAGGTLQDDEIKSHTHSHDIRRAGNTNAGNGGVIGNSSNSQNRNTGAFGGEETRTRNIGESIYMRIM